MNNNEMANGLKKSRIKTPKKILRVAKYVRVSTDEQKLKRNSIEAQHEILDQFIADNDHLELVGTYADEGVSGTKFMRTELQRLLSDVEAGLIDLIIVTKLDRWFRDVALYYKTQEKLDRNKCAWFTVLEDYETLTSDGRFKVNIMLSVYQNEVDRTSERIKVVQEYKIKHGQAITGSLPFGFTIKGVDNYKIVVKDPETAPILEDLLDHLYTGQSVRASINYINDKYGLKLLYNPIRKLIGNPLLYGSYHDNDNYCEPYITKERFDEINRAIKLRNIKQGTLLRPYQFSGLIKCPICGNVMAGCTFIRYHNGVKKEYAHYRCNRAKKSAGALCSFTGTLTESKLETQILNKLRPSLEELELKIKVEAQTVKKPRYSAAAVEEEMRRLNVMYKKGRINDEEYDLEYTALENKLKQAKPPEEPKNYDDLHTILDQDLVGLFGTFTTEEKRTFWRAIIDHIEVDENKEPTIYFL